MTIARFGDRFHEVFIADVDRSFDDAIFTGERVYVRDLESNDSTMVYGDTIVVKMAARHAQMHPDAVQLDQDDDTPRDPDISVSGETDILEVRGPYALLEHRTEYEMRGGEQHDTVHTAVDLRTGVTATSISMVHDSTAEVSNLAQSLPHSFARKDYTVDARRTGDGSVSLSLKKGARGSWPLFSVGGNPRFYWLDDPAVNAATRLALVRAFNSAASYDESVKYVKDVRPAPKAPVTHHMRHA
jgi:hypothetical protein